MKTDDLRRIINQNPELIKFKRQLVGCCRKKAPDETILRRVKDFVINYPQYQKLMEPLMEK